MAKTLQYQALVEPFAQSFLPIFVQSVTAFDTNTTQNITLAGVTAKNALLLGVSTLSDWHFPATVKDSSGNTWTHIISSQSPTDNTRTEFFIAQQVAAGSVSVVVTWNASVLSQLWLIEAANIADNAVFNHPTTFKDDLDEGATTGTAHLNAFTGLSTDPAGSLIVCVGSLSTAYATVTPGANYTLVADQLSQSLFQYQITSKVLPTEKGAFTTNNASSNNGLIVELAAGTPAPGGAPVPFFPALQQNDFQTSRSRFLQSDSFFSPLTQPSAPVGPTTAQIMAALQPPAALPPPKARFIGSDGSVAPIEPTLYVKQNIGWLVQHPEATRPRTPAQTGIYSEMVDPTIFVKQKMDWYVQHPTPIAYKQPMAHTLYVQPLVSIAPVQLLNNVDAYNVTIIVSMAVNPTILQSSAVNPDT